MLLTSLVTGAHVDASDAPVICICPACWLSRSLCWPRAADAEPHNRLRWRDGYNHKPVWMKPDNVYEVELGPMNTSN